MAEHWFRIAAEQGYRNAQHNLAVIYGLGQGVPKDYVEAARWWRKAAEQGEVEAQANLGVIYDNGIGVKKDVPEAMRWWRKAAAQGDINAKNAIESHTRIQHEDPKTVSKRNASAPTSKTCYELGNISKATSQTRRQFALDSSHKMEETVGYDVVNVTSGGDDNKYLLFFSTPQNEPILRQVADGMISAESIRVNFCMQGFAEVQFLVRDANLHQRLVTKHRTNVNELGRYLQEHDATPIP